MNLEEIKEKATAEGIFRASQHNMNRAEAGYNAKWFKRGAIFGAELQAKTMYSAEEVIYFLQQYRYDLSSKKTPNLGDTTKQWFEKLKNK